MNAALKKAISMSTQLLITQFEAIEAEAIQRHADQTDMTFAIQFKWPVKCPGKLVASLKFSTPHTAEMEGHIGDPNQPDMFENQEDSDE